MASQDDTTADMNFITQNFSNSSLGGPEVRLSAARSDTSLEGFSTKVEPRKLFPANPAEGIEDYKQMRVVLWQTAAGLKPPSGGFRGNYATLHSLSGYGHKTMQFCWALDYDLSDAIAELKRANRYNPNEWKHDYVDMLNTKLETVRVPYWKFTDVRGVYIVCLDALLMLGTLPNELQQEDAAEYIETGTIPKRAAPYAKFATEQIELFQATHVLFNDAFANKITSEVPICKSGVCKRVEIIHSAEQVPVGPFTGGVPGSAKTSAELALWHDLDGVVSVSNALRDYVKKHAKLDTIMIPNHVWSYKDKNTGDWPRFRSNYGLQTVVMVNPALVKGHKIFLDMAKENDRRSLTNRFSLNAEDQKPTYKFIAYMGWGSRPEILEDLKAAGIEVRKSLTDMEPAFDATSILIVPSLWFEAWGIVATEAMLRGIPVIASNVGGLPEAKRFVWPLIPVNPITGEDRREDGSYNVPEQDATPFIKALDEIMSSEERYRAAADASFYTVRNWCRYFPKRQLEEYLMKMM